MKKIISMVLVFVMILSFMPIGALPAYAEYEENSIQEIGQEVLNDTTLVEDTNDQNSETNLGQTENQEQNEQTPGQEISGELDNSTENGENQESELINSDPIQEPEQQEGGNGTQGDTEEPVFVYFAMTPVDATVTVYTVDEENPEDSQIVVPQDDPYLYLLQPGLYCYTVEAEGYYDIAKALLYVEPSDDTYIVEREMERDESIVLEDESEAEVSAQSVSLKAGGQRMVTLSFAVPENMDACWVTYEGGLPASITGPIGFIPSEPFTAPIFGSNYSGYYTVFMGWSATQKKVVSGYTNNKTNLSDTSELYFDPNSVYKKYRWEWGTRLISDTVLYAQVLQISTNKIPVDLNGQRDQNNLFVLHHTDHIVANDSILYHDSMQSGVDIDLWPFCYYNYAGHDRNGKNNTDYLATAENWVEEDGWTFIGYRYLDEMIYYYDEMGKKDAPNYSEQFWGYDGDTWDYNQIYEVWCPNDQLYQTVTFDANGYGVAPETQNVVYAHKATRPADLTASGAIFNGWYKDAEATEVFDFDTPITEATTVYAGWEESPTVTVTFDYAGHGNQSNYSVEVNPGSYIEQPADPTDENYTFMGWKAADGSKFNFSAPITANTTITASWEAIPVTVTFDANGHGTAPAAQTVNKGQKASVPTAPTAAHYTFTGWYSEANCTNAFDFNSAITADRTLYAGWKGEDCTVSFDLNKDGATNCPAAQTVEYGKKATQPSETPAAEGYVFNGWQLDGSAYDFSQAVTGNITLTAAWRAAGNIPYAVEYFMQDEAGSSNFTKDDEQTDNLTGTTGETITATPKAIDGFVFDDANTGNIISGTIKANGSLVLKLYYKVDANKNGIADDEEIFTITFDSNGGSAVDAQTVKFGEKASKPADPTRQGYVFGAWQLNGAEYDFNTAVKSDITLVATWNSAGNTPYTVEYYKQAEAGSTSFKKDDSISDRLTGTTGETVTASPKVIEGFVYDRSNSNNVTSGTIAADGSLVLKLYYKVDANKNGIADDEESYTVTFNSNGGSAVDAQTVKFGEKASKPADPTKQGYVFGTWQLNGAEYDFNTAVKSDITLVATWNSAGNTPYTVEYYKQAEAGSTSFKKDDSISDRLTGTTGKTATASPKAIEGFVYDSKNSNNIVSGTIKADGSLVLKLYYKVDANKNGIADDEESFTITFDSNGGSAVDAQTVKFGEKASKPTNPTKQGYVFGAWQLNGAEYDFNTAVKGGITLIATWNAAGNTPYTIEYYKQTGAGSTSFTRDDSISDRLTGTTGDTATASPKAIEGFVYDSKNSNNVVSGTIKADGSLVLKLYYKVDANKNGIADDEENYTVTFNSAGGSAVEAQTVKFGEKASKPADPTKQGYVFGAWQLDGAEYDFNTAVKGNITLIATWNAAGNTPYTIEYYKQAEAGSSEFKLDSSMTETQTGATGATANIAAKPVEGFVYDRNNSGNVTSGTIKADGSLLLKLYYKVDANKNGIADDEEDYTVTFDSNGGSRVTVQTVRFGGKAEKPADPTMEGYVFGTWQLNGSNYDFNTAVKSDITLKAAWNAATDTPYTIEYYTQTAAGSREFILDSDLTETKTGATGKTANAEAKPVDGFVFDSANTKNMTSGTIAADGSLVLKLYYKVDANKNGIADDEETFTVSFDLGRSDATGKPEDQGVKYGEKASAPSENPKATGYEFVAWQLDGSNYDFNRPVTSDITLTASWKAAGDTPYTVEYYKQAEAGSTSFEKDNALTEELSGTTGETATVSPKAIEGFVYDSSNSSNVTSGTIAEDGSLVLKLYYKVDANKNGIADDEEDYTVTFDSNGGSELDAQTVRFGNRAEKPADPAKQGYVFGTWTMNGTEYDFETPVKADITLVATWNTSGDTLYTVEHYKQTEAGSMDYTRDDSLTERLKGTTNETANAAAKNIDGFVFDSDNANNVSSGTIAADGSLVLKLYYKVDADKNGIADDEDEYIVTFDSNGGSPVESQNVRFGDTVKKPADPTKQGYVFVEWIRSDRLLFAGSLRSSRGFDFSTPVTRKITLVAVWEAATDTPFTVEHYKQNEAGSKEFTKDATLTDNLTGNTGESATAKDKEISGYVFDENNTDNVITGIIEADGSLVLKLYYKVDANYNGIADDEEDYLVTFDSNGGSTVENQMVHFGDKASKPADPTLMGYVFAGWTLSGSEYDFDTPVKSNITLVAVWNTAGDTPYTVEHYMQKEAGSSEYTKDDSLTENLTGTTGATATATGKNISGYVFDSDNENNVASGAIAADGSLLLKLYYKVDANGNGIPDDEEDYTVSFDSNGGSAVESQTVHFGDKASKPADPTLMGYVFNAWTVDGKEYDFETPIKNNITLKAVWNTSGDTPYTVQYYKQTAAGSDKFLKDSALTENLTGTTEETATVAAKAIEGYVFDSENSNNVVSGTIAADGSLVLKLYYKVDANKNGIADDEEDFTVNFIGEDDEIIDTQSIHYGDCVTKPTDPEKTGYDFDGWKKDGRNYDFNTPVTSPLDLRVSWKASDNTAYTVEHYMQTAAGKNEYTKDADLTDHLKGTTEQTASAKAKKISGYVFDSDNENNVISGTIAADGSLVLKLYYKVDANNNGTPDDEEQYTVTFDSRGGSKIHSQIVAYGEKASKPAEDPTSNGKQFTGWFTDESCAEVFDFNKPITANTTVYAGWIKVYTVSFKMNGVTPKAAIENQSVLDGELAKRPEGSPEADKYLFKDWYADAAGTEKFDFNAPITADTTVYAIWVKIHEVRFDINNTKATSDPIESQFVVNGEKASAPEEAPTAKAAQFTGWYKDKAATEEFDFSAAITADTTVYAGWINEFTVSFDMNNEKSDSKEANQIVRDGDTASKPEKDPEASGYKFLGWTKDKEGKEAFDFTTPITADTVVYAQWEKQLTVKFMVNNDRCQNTYSDQILEPGRTAMRPAEDPTASGYRFNGWFKDAAGTEEFDFNEKITDDTIIYAGWTRVHSVQFVVRNSSASGTPKAQVVVNGEKAIKPEDPTVIGMTFEGWFTDSNGTKAYDFNTPVTEDLILYDKWSTTKCSVIFNNMGVGTEIATQTVDYGTKAVEPTNITADGYTFGGWYTDRDHQNKYDFSKPVTSSMTLYAKWTANSTNGSNNGKGPMTGELNNPGLLIGITAAALVALGGAGYILVKKNKKTDNEKSSDKSENKTEENK